MDTTCDSSYEDTCIVCLEHSVSEYNELKCNCKFNAHDDCIQKWIDKNNNCPICREVINVTSNQSVVDIPYYEQRRTKIIIYTISLSIFIFLNCVFISIIVFGCDIYRSSEEECKSTPVGNIGYIAFAELILLTCFSVARCYCVLHSTDGQVHTNIAPV